MKKISMILLVVLLLTGCGFINSDFDDQQLKLGVDRVLRQQGYTRRDYDKITYIDLSYLGIENLDGVEKLKNLKSIDISNNYVEDLSPLSKLDNLEIIDIQNNRVKDLSPLKDLENLKILLIRDNAVEDIEVLAARFPGLETTDFLVHVKFNDPAFEALIRNQLKTEDQIMYHDLEKIRTLDLTETGIKDIGGIEHARFLEQLVIDGPVKHIENIRDLVNLKSLVLRHNELTSANIVEKLSKLESLDLSNNSIVNINALSNLNLLTQLNLSHNKISDLSGLAELKNLTGLFLDGNPIVDYTSMGDVIDRVKETDVFIVYFSDPNLDLAVRENIKKTTGILTKKDLERVRSLDASGYGIESLGGIELMSNIIELNLNNNLIEDLEPLNQIEALKILKISHNNIENLQPLLYQSNLQILDLSYNNISNIEPLIFVDTLDYLYLEGNVIEESIQKDELKAKLTATDQW